MKMPFFLIISEIFAIKIESFVNISSSPLPFKNSLLFPNKFCVSKLQYSILRFFFFSKKIGCGKSSNIVLNRNEEVLGELFTFFILETILIGRFLDVNPFDQPAVEFIKKETKKILTNT